jgi:hypothetical protein
MPNNSGQFLAMIELLRDPVWQFVGALLAAIAIGIAILVYYRQRRRKRLGYQILANTPVLTVDEEIRGKLKIWYEDIPVRNLQLLLLKFINTGNVPIATADFERPLSITFGSEAKILSSEIIASSPSDLSPSISATTHGIALAPLLLNPNDYFTIKALVSERQGGVSVTARIIGVERVVYLKESLLIKRGALLFAFVLSGLLSGIVSNWLTVLTTVTRWKAPFYYAAFGVAVIALAISYFIVNFSGKRTKHRNQPLAQHDN